MPAICDGPVPAADDGGGPAPGEPPACKADQFCPGTLAPMDRLDADAYSGMPVSNEASSFPVDLRVLKGFLAKNLGKVKKVAGEFERQVAQYELPQKCDLLGKAPYQRQCRGLCCNSTSRDVISMQISIYRYLEKMCPPLQVRAVGVSGRGWGCGEEEEKEEEEEEEEDKGEDDV